MIALFQRCACRMRIKNLPDDVEVINVGWETRYQQFLFLVTHPSFDEVPLGDMIPFVDQKTELVEVDPDQPAQAAILGFLEMLTDQGRLPPKELDPATISALSIVMLMQEIPGDRYELYEAALKEAASDEIDVVGRPR